MAQQKKPMGLGRGLDAVISANSRVANLGDGVEGAVIEIDINKIEPNRDQPRRHFDDDSLHELASSLSEFGMIQPVVVKAENGFYSLIAGERRWRAARIAKLGKIPAIVKDYSPVEILQIALVENIQRKDLSPIEEALCYKRLTEEFFFTQENIAQKVGKSRNIISAAMSLLNLDPRVQNFIVEMKLSAGHGRALLSISSGSRQFELAEKIIDEDLSVREAEQLVKSEAMQKAAPDKPQAAAAYAHVERDLKTIFGTQVRIRDGKSKGKIEIDYYSPDELDRLLGMFKGLESGKVNRT